MKRIWEKILDDESHPRLPSLSLAQYVGSIVVTFGPGPANQIETRLVSAAISRAGPF